ncbi:MarR family EPS-associated transcriptional regulator [Arenicellales bacterium IMCC56312]
MIDERHLKALRFLKDKPEITQRELAVQLGVSVGATNYCLKALVEKGWIKLENFQRNPKKLGYLYLLTPKGLVAKTALTTRFLKSKIQEHEQLKEEIASLSAELEENNKTGQHEL